MTDTVKHHFPAWLSNGRAAVVAVILIGTASVTGWWRIEAIAASSGQTHAKQEVEALAGRLKTAQEEFIDEMRAAVNRMQAEAQKALNAADKAQRQVELMILIEQRRSAAANRPGGG